MIRSSPRFTCIFNQLLQIFRFSIAGGLSTLIHMAVVVCLGVFFVLNPFFVNFLGFLVAFGFAFLMHFNWTFSKANNFKKSIFRYFVTSFTAFLISNILLKIILVKLSYSDSISIILSIFFIPPIVFIISKFWAFAPQK